MQEKLEKLVSFSLIISATGDEAAQQLVSVWNVRTEASIE